MLQPAIASEVKDARSIPEGARTLPDVFKIDNLLIEREQRLVLDLLNHGGWRFGWKSHGATDTYKFWHKHYAGHHNKKDQKPYPCVEELKNTSPIAHALWMTLADKVFKGHTLYRCYANAQAYGSDGTLHRDSKSDHSYTAVYYPHLIWEPDWAGETVIFNKEKTDVIHSFYPRPNRLAVFKGNLPHVARGVSRTCPALRITLMFKCFEDGHEYDREEVQEIPA